MSVYRNGRYEQRLAALDEKLEQISAVVLYQAQLVDSLARALAKSQDPENLIPPLPDPPRPFGMGH